MNNVIEHTGIVEYVNENNIGVKIIQSSACSGCKAKSFCASNENKEVHVDIPITGTDNNVTIGQEVIVCASASTGRTAIFYAFVVPLIIMVAVLVAVLLYSDSEQMAAVAGILSLVAYYILLSFNKSKLQKRLSFWIKEKSNQTYNKEL